MFLGETKMNKKIICSIAMLLYTSNVYANLLEQQEESFKKISQLESKLRELELQKQIQELEIEILKNHEILTPKPKPKPTMAAPPVTKKRPVVNKAMFNPEILQLNYIIGTGDNRIAIFNRGEKSYSFNNNSNFLGWRISIRNNNVIFTKGNERITK